jgi:nucleosome assembly protein 1-like 1
LKYEKMRTPYIQERTKIVNKKSEDGKFVGLPCFWENVIKNSELAGDLVQPHDYDSLKYLEDVTFVLNEDPKGYTLEFHFTENPYFTNTVLQKQYFEKEGDVFNAKGTKIEWKEDKNLTQKVVFKKKKHKGGGKTKKVKTFEEQESFYRFFLDYEEAEEGSEEFYVREHLLNSDIDIGQNIRESIIPNAIDYYLGKIEIESGMMGGEDDFGEEDFDDEE